MTDKVLIRSETSADVSAIAEVSAAAFKTLAISNHTEQFIIAALRAATPDQRHPASKMRNGWEGRASPIL